jgi:predicted nucleotidyltransferase
MDSGLDERVVGVLRGPPAVRSIQLVGSRAEGCASERSDWDFSIETDDFDALARELPDLLAPLAPLAQQWDRLGPYRCWMLVLPRPVRVEMLFPHQPQEPRLPWVATAGNLAAIDRQFWDWVLWASGKEAAGKTDVVAAELRMLFDHYSRRSEEIDPRSRSRTPSTPSEGSVRRPRNISCLGAAPPRSRDRCIAVRLSCGAGSRS